MCVCVCVYNRSLLARLDFDFRHVRLVHAQGTKLEIVGAQERFRGQARYAALSADEFDTDLAAFGVVTMLEESNVEVLVSPRSFRIFRGQDASQVAAVEWRRRNERSI